MDPEKEKPSAVQNVAGKHHKVVGGNIFYGPANIHIHGDTTSKKEEENSPSGGPLDSRVEAMLTKLNLMSLKTIFIEEELTMPDLARFTRAQLSTLGISNFGHKSHQ